MHRQTRRLVLAFVIAGTVMSYGASDRLTLAAERPNILFIMTDQQSADVMSCRMGDRYLRTPAMDGLAKQGTVFTRAYAPNPLCMPARNSIFTGRYPHETGVTRRISICVESRSWGGDYRKR